MKAADQETNRNYSLEKKNTPDPLDSTNKLFHYNFESKLKKNTETFCGQCETYFDNFLSRANHHCLPHRCKKCSRAFHYDYQLKIHNCSTEKPVFLCIYCESRFHQARLLCNHYSACTMIDKCKMCKKSILHKSVLCQECKKMEETSSTLPPELSCSVMETGECGSIASQRESASSHSGVNIEKTAISSLPSMKMDIFENNNSNILKCIKRRASGSFDPETTDESSHSDSSAMSKKLKKQISKVGAKVILQKIDISSFKVDSTSVNSAVNPEQNPLLSSEYSSVTNCRKPCSASSLQKIKHASTDFKTVNKEDYMKRKKMHSSAFSSNSPKRVRKTASSPVKRNSASSRKNSLERASPEKPVCTFQNVAVALQTVRSGSSNLDIPLVTTEQRIGRCPLSKASEADFSESDLNSSTASSQYPVTLRKNDVRPDPNQTRSNIDAKHGGKELTLEVLFNNLPDDDSGILLRVPTGNGVSFRCTKCTQLFKYAKRAAIHYSQCKHPRMKRHRTTFPVKDVEWICLQCYYHCNENNDLLVHKRLCSISCSTVSSIGADIERDIQDYAQTYSNICKKCSYKCLSVVSFNEHCCEERLQKFKSCKVFVKKIPEISEIPNVYKFNCQICGYTHSDKATYICHLVEYHSDLNLNEENVSQLHTKDNNLENCDIYQSPSTSANSELHSGNFISMMNKSSAFSHGQNSNATNDLEGDVTLVGQSKVYIQGCFEENLNDDNISSVSDDSELDKDLSPADQLESRGEVHPFVNNDINKTFENSSFFKERCCEQCRAIPCEFCINSNPNLAKDVDYEKRGDIKPCFTCLTANIKLKQKNLPDESEENEVSEENEAPPSSEENDECPLTDNACVSTTLNTPNCPVAHSEEMVPDASTEGASYSNDESISRAYENLQSSNNTDPHSEVSKSHLDDSKDTTVYPKVHLVRLVRKQFLAIDSDNPPHESNLAVYNYISSMVFAHKVKKSNETENYYLVSDVTKLSEKIPHLPSQKSNLNQNYMGNLKEVDCKNTMEETPSSAKLYSMEYNEPDTFIFVCHFERLIYDLAQFHFCEMFISLSLGHYEIQVMWCFDVDIKAHIQILKNSAKRTDAEFICGICHRTLTVTNMIEHVAKKHEKSLINILIN